MALLCCVVMAMPGAAVAAKPDAEGIHFDATVVDTHNDTMMRVIDAATWKPANDLLTLDRQINLQKVKDGGLDVAFYAAFTGYQGNTAEFLERYGVEGRAARTNSRSLAMINALYWSEASYPDRMTIASSLKAIEAGVRSGKHVAVPTLEGMYGFESFNAVELMRQYYDLGVRGMAIVWNPVNALGAGTSIANDAPNAGLTDLRKQVIAEMNRLGIIVDVSHMNETTFYDSIAVSKAPLLATHSGASAIRPHVRNLTDDQLLAIKENGGVAQVNFWDEVVVDKSYQVATVAALVDHIDHMVKLIGVDHVGIGSDFDGATMPVDLLDASYLPALTKELVARGYSTKDIGKILGGNSLRVLKEVERLAEKSPANQGQTSWITADFDKGDTFGATPLLTATVDAKQAKKVDPDSVRVIIDGVVYEPSFDAKAGTITYQVEEPLLGAGPTNADGTAQMAGNYHVVTFEATNHAGKISRATEIFYVE